MAKKNHQVSWELDEDNMLAIAVLKERNEKGEFEEVSRTEFDFAAVEDAGLHPMVSLYGLSKILQDRSSGTDTGPDKMDVMKGTFSLLASGQRKKVRASAGGGGGGVAPEVEAIAEVKNTTISQAAKAWKAQSDEQKEHIRTNLKEKIQEVKDRRKESGELDLSDIG